jgi:branched-chain amino acid aminotransferase
MNTVASTFRAQDIAVNPVDIKKIKPDRPGQFSFGKHYTDHMLSIDWSKEQGWAAPEIIPHGPIKIETSATSLHYGISVHESVSIVKNSKDGKM